MWETSGHSRALSRIGAEKKAAAACLDCHLAEGFRAQRRGKNLEPDQLRSLSSLTCTTCHDPATDTHPYFHTSWLKILKSYVIFVTSRMQLSKAKERRESKKQEVFIPPYPAFPVT